MSDTNSPEQHGAGEDAGQTWPEFLTGGGHGAGSAGPSSSGASSASSSGASSASSSGASSSGSSGASSASGSAGGASWGRVGPAQPQGPGVPRRIIGTPAPAGARTMLPEQGDGGALPPASRMPTDPEDPARAKRVERVVAACFLLAMVAGFGFLVAYGLIGVGSITKALHSNLALGGCLGIAFLLLAVGATIWVRHLMPNVEMSEERHPLRSDPEHREAFKETFEEGAATSQFVKRPIVRRTLIAATVPLAVAPVFLLRDLGPLPGDSLGTTVWRKGLRLLVYGTGRPITPAEFNSPGSLLSVGPEGYLDNDDAMAKAAVIIIKFRPGQLQRPTKLNWTIDNIVAYSKICTHVGCPAALYEQTTHHILCPCHQSTFDAAHGARVVFGPATRALPQLPIGIDDQGYLIATGAFDEPVGPSYWERS